MEFLAVHPVSVNITFQQAMQEYYAFKYCSYKFTKVSGVYHTYMYICIYILNILFGWEKSLRYHDNHKNEKT